MTKLAPHFSKWEFACRCGKCDWDNIHDSIVWKMEEMRGWLNEHYKNTATPLSVFGPEECERRRLAASKDEHPGYILTKAIKNIERGLFPTSGCRCPAHNKAIGGAEKSWHLPREQGHEEPGILAWDLARWHESGDFLKNHPLYIYALACDFQVKRRVWSQDKIYSGNDRFEDEQLNMVPVKISSPWTIDHAAMRALNAHEDPTLYGGWKLYEEKCKFPPGCNGVGKEKRAIIAKYPVNVPETQEQELERLYYPNDCPKCQGTGILMWIHMDRRGERARGW